MRLQQKRARQAYGTSIFFGNILNAMYYTLLNMFGEFPLVKEHNAWGRVVGTELYHHGNDPPRQ